MPTVANDSSSKANGSNNACGRVAPVFERPEFCRSALMAGFSGPDLRPAALTEWTEWAEAWESVQWGARAGPDAPDASGA